MSLQLLCLLGGLLGLLNQARQRVLIAIVGLRLGSRAVMMMMILIRLVMSRRRGGGGGISIVGKPAAWRRIDIAVRVNALGPNKNLAISEAFLP